MRTYLKTISGSMLEGFGFLSRACGVAPLIVVLVAAGSSDFSPKSGETESAEPKTAPAAPEPDFAVIDSVLSQRAPWLGSDQRERVAKTLIDECRTAGYDPLLILSVIAVESEFDEAALSFRGARGLMQFRPNTLGWIAEHEGVRLSVEEIYRDPAMSVRLGIRYISMLEKQFHGIDLALMAYNAGPGRLRTALHDGDADHFRGYAHRVRTDYARFRRSLGLAPATAVAMRWDAWSQAIAPVPEDL